MNRRRTLQEHQRQAFDALIADAGRSPGYQEAVEHYHLGMGFLMSPLRRGSAHRCFDHAIAALRLDAGHEREESHVLETQ